jgi:hypothetical protein
MGFMKEAYYGHPVSGSTPSSPNILADSGPSSPTIAGLLAAAFNTNNDNAKITTPKIDRFRIYILLWVL